MFTQMLNSRRKFSSIKTVSRLGTSESGSSNIQVIFYLLAALIIVFALAAGILIGDQNYIPLLLAVAAVGTAFFAIVLSRFWLMWIMLYSSLGFIISPAGFAIGPSEIALSFLGCYVLTHCWRKDFYNLPPELRDLKTFLFVSLVFVLYIATIFFWNHEDPLAGESVSWRNQVKSFIQMGLGLGIVWFAITSWRFSTVPRNPFFVMGLVFLFSLLVNIGIRAYAIFFQGYSGLFMGDEGNMLSDRPSTLFIPILNLTENIYQLRGLGPISATLGIVMWVCPGKLNMTLPNRVMSVSLFFVGLAGTLMSGGRASILILFIAAGLILFFNRRFKSLLVMVAFVVITILFVKIIYETDPNLVPLTVQRTVALIPGIDMQEAKAHIEGSSNWRQELATLAFREWLSNARIFWFGRSVYEFSSVDTILSQTGDAYTNMMYISLRRGATHNKVTDLLVTVGLIGFLLYLFCEIVLLFVLLKLYFKATNLDAKALLLFVFTFYFVSFLASLIGGGFLNENLAAIISVALLYYKLNPLDSEKKQAVLIDTLHSPFHPHAVKRL
jgi:MFS family permease